MAFAEYLRSKPWDSLSYKVPARALQASGMLMHMERIMLSWLASNFYSGEGEIVELGVFIGSSSISLATGLEKNVEVNSKEKRIHAFDRFEGDYECDFIRKNTSFVLGEDGGFRSIYDAQIKQYEGMINVEAGDLNAKKWCGKPIEILFVDVLKSPSLTDTVVREFFPYLVPGRSVLVMQDYLFQILPYSVVLMEVFADYFERAGDTEKNSVLFVNKKKIPDELIMTFGWWGMSDSLRLHYLMQALGKQDSFFGKECVAHLISDFLQGKYK